ncbi:TraC family protein [Rhizobium sp. CC1099]|uniref:TraC family protein n=1 Tax=Rhizobium sp. CC1099 TaxID=3039160 RepID=UPI0024B1647B|nr:TraC family protein [Rhizobium sp. CC1099]WFU89607.1 TraC family protein [Rhizobium sp. CC1099]
MAAKLSISELDAQIEKLKERRKFLIVKSAERFARAATKAGLAEMELSDGELDGIVAEIAARFRKEERKTASGASSQAGRSADCGPGTPAPVSHDG